MPECSIADLILFVLSASTETQIPGRVIPYPGRAVTDLLAGWGWSDESRRDQRIDFHGTAAILLEKPHMTITVTVGLLDEELPTADTGAGLAGQAPYLRVITDLV